MSQIVYNAIQLKFKFKRLFKFIIGHAVSYWYQILCNTFVTYKCGAFLPNPYIESKNIKIMDNNKFKLEKNKSNRIIAPIIQHLKFLVDQAVISKEFEYYSIKELIEMYSELFFKSKKEFLKERHSVNDTEIDFVIHMACVVVRKNYDL